MNRDLPERIRRQLGEAGGAEPPADLLDQLSEAVRVTPQRRSLLATFPLAGWAIAPAVAAALLLVAVMAPWRGPIASSPEASASGVASEVPGPDDDLPSTFMGEAVLRGDAIREHVLDETSDSPFLIGGWLLNATVDCSSPPTPGRPDNALAPWCPSGWFLIDRRLRPENVLAPFGQEPKPVHLVIYETLDGSEWNMASAVILRVHAHDSAADECPAEIREECERAVVVEEVVWSGASE